MTDTKPRDAGEVMLDILALADTMHRPDVLVADMLIAWRREIEAAMVERIARALEAEPEAFAHVARLGGEIRARFGCGR